MYVVQPIACDCKKSAGSIEDLVSINHFLDKTIAESRLFTFKAL